MRESAEAIVPGCGRSTGRAEREEGEDLTHSLDGQGEQTTPQGAYRSKGVVEPQGATEGRSLSTVQSRTPAGEGAERELFDSIFHDGYNWSRATDRVIRNGGAPGLDGVRTTELRDWMHQNVGRIGVEIAMVQHTDQAPYAGWRYRNPVAGACAGSGCQQR